MPTNQPPIHLVLAVLRLVQGWSQRDLARVSGIPANLLSDYERGRKPLSRERLEILIGVMGLSTEMIDSTLAFIRTVRTYSPGAGLPSDEQRRRIERFAAEMGAKAVDFTRSTLMQITTAGQAERERQEAEAVWARLKERTPAQRRRIVEESSKIRTWALCEKVCRESVDAARDSADRALDLAELALRIAELMPGDEAWRSRVQGYAWAHVGNARRVRGNLPGAEEAFRLATNLWEVGKESDFDLLEESLVLGLEASLRREQRRLGEALALLDQALAKDRGDLKTQLLLNKANTLEDLGDFKRAVEVLRLAAAGVGGDREPRLLFALKFNLAANLCFLGRFADARELVEEVRRLALTLGNDLDLLRFRWLAGRIDAGLGNCDEAIAALLTVQQGFTAREIAYDSGLVSLELAGLYLEKEWTSEVKMLARQMLWIFQSQGVPREALAALRIFCEAVEKEAVSLEMVRQITVFLLRARNNPDLRLEDISLRKP